MVGNGFEHRVREQKFFLLGILTETRSGDALNARDYLFAFGSILKLDSQNALLIVLCETVIPNVTFPLQYFGDCHFNFRAGNFYFLVVDGIGIAYAREHICNRIRS